MTTTNHTSLGGENAHAQPLDPARICSKKDGSIIEATLKKHYGTCFTQQEVQFARELANSLRMPVDAPVSRASENPIGEDAVNGAMGERGAFERHWYNFYHSGSIKARSDGRYMQPIVQHAWEAWQARAASTQAKVCSTCNGHGMIGGPSYYAPDEGGEPCPDCVAAPQPAQSPDGRIIDKAMVKRLAVQHGLLPVQTERTLTDEHLSDLQEAREILENMVRSVELDGNYSTEATCTFLRQALLCLPAAQPASGGDRD